MNWLLYAFIASLSVNILGLWIIAGLQSRIEGLEAEIDRLRGVKTGEAGA